MSKAAWERLFGLPRSHWAGRDPARRPLPEDCDVVITRASLKTAGVTNPTRTQLKLERDPRFHHRVVILPDGRRVNTTAVQSYSWLLGVQHDEDRARSLANLMVGSQAPIETFVTKPQGSWGATFEPEIWEVPRASPAPRPSAPLREAHRRPDPSRRQADRAGAAAPRNDDPELEKEMRNQLHDDARRLLATTGPLGLAAIAAGLHLSTRDRRVALAWALRNTDGTIIGEPGEGGILYHVAP